MHKTIRDGDHIETIVIGGGQCGLAVGYDLGQRGREYVILDAGERVGDVWRKRWDSLLMFTPARYNALPGMKFPAKADTFVGKDAMADYLESYALANDLPIQLGVRVEHVSHDGERYVVGTNRMTLYSDNVVVAMAEFQVPKVPPFAGDLDPTIVQLHSTEYKNPDQLQPGPVLVVGLGNSGADIGLEVAATHETYIAGKESAHIPFRIEPWFGRNVLVRLVRFMMIDVITTSTPIGRRVLRKNGAGKAAPLVRVKPKDLAAVAERVSRVAEVRDGQPVLDDGRRLDVANVIWCTGFERGFPWIDLDVFDENGRPRHERGVVADQPGLYFCGLDFLHSLWSETVIGEVNDARYVVKDLTANRPPVRRATV